MKIEVPSSCITSSVYYKRIGVNGIDVVRSNLWVLV